MAKMAALTAFYGWGDVMMRKRTSHSLALLIVSVAVVLLLASSSSAVQRGVRARSADPVPFFDLGTVESKRVVCVTESVPGTAARRVVPRYPQVAISYRFAGTISVRVSVDEKGRVFRAVARNGNLLLRRAAEEAARNWLFNPALLAVHCGCSTNIERTRFETVIRFDFKLAC